MNTRSKIYNLVIAYLVEAEEQDGFHSRILRSLVNRANSDDEIIALIEGELERVTLSKDAYKEKRNAELKRIYTHCLASVKAIDSQPKYDSLQQSWGASKQQRWRAWREETVNTLVRFMSENNPEFKDVYQLIVNERGRIAKELSPEYEKEILTSRIPASPIEEPESDVTPVMSWGKYEAFIDYLSDAFDKTQADFKMGPNPFFQTPSSFGILGYKPFSSSARVEVSHQGLAYSTIHKIEMYEPEKRRGFLIFHANVNNISAICNVVAGLYDELRNGEDLSEIRKIEIFKELVWNLSHAMTQLRGSAAINEITLEGLLKHYDVHYDLDKSLPPIDLIAIFSESPDVFSKRFIINPTLEFQHALQQLIHSMPNHDKSSHSLFQSDNATEMAAKKLLQFVAGDRKVQFDDAERKAMQQKPLADILSRFHRVEALNELAPSVGISLVRKRGA